MVTGVIVSLGGCGKTREAFGLQKVAPDEFAVVTRAPLAIPPDYGLRPPTPGAQRPQETTTKDEAKEILLSSGSNGAHSKFGGKNVSRGEAALLGKAGAQNADPSIRKIVTRESSVLAARDDQFLAALMFWQNEKRLGTLLDARKESRRLRENAALGDAPVKGTTPVIERTQKALLKDLFN